MNWARFKKLLKIFEKGFGFGGIYKFSIAVDSCGSTNKFLQLFYSVLYKNKYSVEKTPFIIRGCFGVGLFWDP